MVGQNDAHRDAQSDRCETKRDNARRETVKARLGDEQLVGESHFGLDARITALHNKERIETKGHTLKALVKHTSYLKHICKRYLLQTFSLRLAQILCTLMVLRHDQSETEFVNGCCFLLFLLMLFILIVDANINVHRNYAQNASNYTE
jgi:hypothetical protein